MTQLRELRLADVRIRPFGRGDETRLRGMSGALSRTSLYLRFFTGTPHVPEPYVAALGRLDHWNRDALVAIFDGAMVGIAEYARLPSRPDEAEVGVLIADAWQRHGLGRLLTRMLLPLAARRGVTGFRAEVQSTNSGAVELIRHTWPSARSVHHGETSTFRMPAPDHPMPASAAPAPPAPVPAALVVSASCGQGVGRCRAGVLDPAVTISTGTSTGG
ncbi:GNAT family N-acetyltransferase [Spirillospora sp. NPDC049652]